MPGDYMAENKVRRVRVEGNQYMDQSSVLGRISIRGGQSFSPTVLSEKVQGAVTSLYESGLFDDVTAWVEYVDDGTDVDLIFKVKELPALDTAIIDGCDEISEEDLRLKIRLIPGRVYSKSQLERDRQAMIDYYHSEGYLLAEVGYRETPVDENKNQVTFIVREGEKVKVRQFDIQGNDHVPAEDIMEHMLTKLDQWWGGGEFKETVFEADRDTVLNAIRHFGYLDAELTDYRAEYLPDSSCLFYLGRMVPIGESLQVLYDQLNRAMGDTATAMAKMAGKPTMEVTHYFRQMHNAPYHDKVSRPLPQVKSEEDALKLLNDIIRYEKSRKEWLKIVDGRKFNNPKIDSLRYKKKRSPYEEKLLVRYMIEDMFPALNKYDNIHTSSAICIHIAMVEGRKYYMGNVHFTGNEVLNDAILNYAFRLDSGEVFDQYKYDASRKAILDSYREDGYLFAQFDEERTFVNDSVVNLTYRMREGLPASIHKVYVRGNTKTDEKVIRREVRLYPGDTYRQSSLERSFREIMQLNYFDIVVPDIKVVGEQEVDLEFTVQEKEAGTGQFSLGVSYSQSDGLVGTASVSIPNWFGGGQSASLSTEYGADKKSVSVSFQEPWFMDKPITVGTSLSYSWWNMSDYDDPNITRYGGQVYVGKRLKWPDDYFYGQVGYSWLMNKQGPNIDDSYVVYTGLESAINFRLIRDDKNLPQFPTDGSRYVLDVQVADDVLYSDFEFVKTELTIKWWFPLFRDRLAIALTNEYGVIFGDQLQYRTLYSMGGVMGYEGMMRGYSSGSIGYRRLGRSFQYIGAELQFGVVPQTFYLLPFFFDAGNVFGERYNPRTKVPKPNRNPLSEWDPSSLKKDIGFGFRVVVPMLGIIGFDFAWPLDVGETYSGLQRTEVGDMEFNFVIGQGF